MAKRRSLPSVSRLPQDLLLRAQLRPVVERLVQSPLPEPGKLRNSVVEYGQQVLLGSKNEFLFREQVQALVHTSLALLDSLNEQTPTSHRELILAAVQYFVLQDDATQDLDSVIGFDDDAEVMNAVLAFIKRSDLLVPRVE